jgi:hypothetical protein
VQAAQGIRRLRVGGVDCSADANVAAGSAVSDDVPVFNANSFRGPAMHSATEERQYDYHDFVPCFGEAMQCRSMPGVGGMAHPLHASGTREHVQTHCFALVRAHCRRDDRALWIEDVVHAALLLDVENHLEG